MVRLSCCPWIALVSTNIVNQNTEFRNIISVIVLDLEVVDGYRCFQDFMLDFLDNDIFAIDENENVAGAELNGILTG